MSEASAENRVGLLEAISFAARAHRLQLRKDEQTPYVAHPFRVCLIAGQVFGITDSATLIAAVLHDTIEDTTTDFDDISERFGDQVALIVAALSKDSRLSQEIRDAEYCQNLNAADDRVKIIKLADTFDNLIDSRHLRPEKRAKTIAKATLLLDLLEQNGSAEVRRCAVIVREHALATAESA